MGRGPQPSIQSEVKSFADSTNSNKKHPKTSFTILRFVSWFLEFFIVTVNVMSQLLRRKSLIQKSFSRKRGRAKQAVCEAVLLFFLIKHILLKSMFMIRRQAHTQTLTLLSDCLVSKPGVRVGPF